MASAKVCKSVCKSAPCKCITYFSWFTTNKCLDNTCRQGGDQEKKFQLINDYHFNVPCMDVYIRGSIYTRALVDTGAAHNSVSEQLANSLFPNETFVEDTFLPIDMHFSDPDGFSTLIVRDLVEVQDRSDYDLVLGLEFFYKLGARFDFPQRTVTIYSKTRKPFIIKLLKKKEETDKKQAGEMSLDNLESIDISEMRGLDDPDLGLGITIEVRGYRIGTSIDTGASVTGISENLVHVLNLDEKVDTERLNKMKGSWGRKHNRAKGALMDAPIRIGPADGYHIKLNFPMMVERAYGTSGCELVLGMDLLTRYGCVLDFNEKYLSFERLVPNCIFKLEPGPPIHEYYDDEMSGEEDFEGPYIPPKQADKVKLVTSTTSAEQLPVFFETVDVGNNRRRRRRGEPSLMKDNRREKM